MSAKASRQHKLGSGFGPATTAQDVLRGIDLSGRCAIVTGGYSGLGLVAATELAAAGARVIVPARRPELARRRLSGVDGVEIDRIDLGDLDSVRAFAQCFLDSGRVVDIIINGAGVMAIPQTRVGPGWEGQFAINHLGHYALVNLLWPAIAKPGGRIVAVSSIGHQMSAIRWDDVQFEHGYDKWKAYGQSKTAVALFAVQLDALAKDAGVHAFATFPGGVPSTALFRHLSTDEQIARGWLNPDGTRPASSRIRTPEQGAATQLWAATSPQLEGIGGVYCENCDIAEQVDDSSTSSGVRDYAIDADEAAKLWALSARLTHIDAFAAGG